MSLIDPEDERRAFEAGYRWGYGNGDHDARSGEDFNNDPGEAYWLWVEEDQRDDTHRQMSLPGTTPWARLRRLCRHLRIFKP